MIAGTWVPCSRPPPKTCLRKNRIGRREHATRRTNHSIAPAALRDRDSARVGCKPGVEVEQLRVQRAREFGVAVAKELVAENGLELEHVAEIFGPGKAQTAVDIERHILKIDLAPE